MTTKLAQPQEKTLVLVRKKTIFKRKLFLKIIVSVFFSFYIFFYTQTAFAFHLPIDFCIVYGHIGTFFLFLV